MEIEVDTSTNDVEAYDVVSDITRNVANAIELGAKTVKRIYNGYVDEYEEAAYKKIKVSTPWTHEERDL